MALWGVSWVDRTIPGELLVDPYIRGRARILQVTFALGILGIGLGAVSAYISYGQVFVTQVISFVGFASGIVLLRVTKSVRAMGILMVAMGLFAVTANAVEEDGLVYVMTWGGILIVAAMYIVGLRAGWAIGAITVVATFLMSWGHQVGVFRGRLGPDMELSNAIMVANQMLLMLVFATQYAREHRALTERLEEARQQAEASSRAKSVFLATMSHEIRTPMNGVLASADLLRRADLPPEEQALAKMVFDSGELLLALLNDILDLSKLEAGRVELEPRPFNPRAMVAAVAHLLRAKAHEHGDTIEVQVELGVPAALVGDELRLRQVLLNLVGNAVKFTQEGRVRLHLGLEGEQVVFRVEDSGCGMTPEQEGRLFRPFSQGDASVQRTHGGSGLGLAISQHLVMAMGGRIVCETKLGVGSTFSFALRLPEADEEAHIEAELESTGDLPRLDGAVLVVDDNTINRRVALRMLERMGCSTVDAEDGQVALTRIREVPVALVLMDREMPVLDGLAATREIRRLPGGLAETPVVGITASALSEEIASCLDAGMQEVLPKPVTVRMLHHAVSRWGRRAG
ncbi:MAG: response regulator [Myxococcales bacterium]|nr:response regulator [Myxococcales bacterium]